MKYLFYLERQLRIYGLIVVSFITSYNVSCYFGWRDPIFVTPELIYMYVWGSLTFIMLGTYIAAKQNPLNK